MLKAGDTPIRVNALRFSFRISKERWYHRVWDFFFDDGKPLEGIPAAKIFINFLVTETGDFIPQFHTIEFRNTNKTVYETEVDADTKD